MRFIAALVSVGLMAVVFFLAFVIIISPITSVNSCYNVTSPGYYVLSADVSGAPYAVSPFDGICIAIQSDNVTFYCNNFNVTNNGTEGMTVGIAAIGPYENVTIVNCPSISGYQYGAGLDGVDHSAIINVTAHDNGDAGIYIARSGDNNQIINCTSYGHHSGQYASDGFYMHSGSNNNFTGNTAYDNDFGFDIRPEASSTTMEDNYAHNNTDTGFYVGNSDYNTLINNSAYDSGDVGFRLNRTLHNTLIDNTAYNSGQLGFLLEFANYSTLSDNTVTHSGFYNIVMGGSTYNNLTNNTVSDSDYGIVLLLGSDHNNLNGDVAHNHALDGFQFDDSDYLSLEGLVSYENDVGFYFNATNYGHITNSIAHNNTRGFSMVFGGINHFNFTHNHALDNDGMGFAGGYGESSEALFYNNTAANNSGDGFLLSGTGDVYLIGNRFLENEDFGVSIEGTTGARIVLENNTAGLNGRSGFYLESGEALFFNNTADSNNESGFVFDGLFGGYPVANNTASSNQDNGFDVIGFPDGVLANNTAYDNEVGFNINSDSNTVSNNDAYSNDDGFYVNSDLNTFTDNTAYDNTWSGFSVSSCSDSNFTNNTAYDNYAGFSITEVSGGVFTVNTVFNNTDFGLYFNTVNGMVFINNSVYNNGEGFEMVGVENTNLTDNEVYGNTGAGLSLSFSDNIAVTNDHYYNNNGDFEVSGSGVSLALKNVIFDNPAGDFTNYTNLSINDTVASSYSIDHADAPGTLPFGSVSFEGKFIDITNHTSDVLIDSIVWHWNENETANYTESLLRIWEYTTSWTMVGATLDTGANTLSITDLQPHSIFAVLETTRADEDGEEEEPEPLSVSFESLCDVNTVTVTSRDRPVSDAKVVVDLVTSILVDNTDGEGQVSFGSYPTHCGKKVTIQVSKKGYSQVSISRALVACELCLPEECTTDDDCPPTHYCMDGECAPVECPCGVIEDHACIEYECCADEDCPEGQECVGHSCREIPVYECESDSDCADTESCEGGSCTSVAGCGYVVDHALVPYECGDEAGCLPCAVGACIEHRCVRGDLTGPDDGFVGDAVSLTATEDGGACANCDVEITDPTGKKFTGRTDENGNLELPLSLKGRYEILLLRNGEPVALKAVNALAKPPITEEKPLTEVLGELLSSLWWVIVALILVAAAIYLSRRGKKRKR